MILITGASSGIGEATARLLASENKNLILIARRIDKLNKLASELQKQYHIKVHAFELDLSNINATNLLFKNNLELFNQVEVLINNAGLAKGLKFFQDVLEKEIHEMLDVNIKSLMIMTKNILPIFLKKNAGHIINIGSTATHQIYPKGNVYCATKAAVHAFNQSLRLDLNGKNIRVTEISPGMVNTEFSTVRFGNKSDAEKVYEGMEALTPMDIAETIAWTINRPKRVNIQEIIIYPTDQASTTLVSRKS